MHPHRLHLHMVSVATVKNLCVLYCVATLKMVNECFVLDSIELVKKHDFSHIEFLNYSSNPVA